MHKIKSSDFKYNFKIFTAFIYYAFKVLRKILQISIIFSKKEQLAISISSADQNPVLILRLLQKYLTKKKTKFKQFAAPTDGQFKCSNTHTGEI